MQILRLHPAGRSFGYAQDDPAGIMLGMTGGVGIRAKRGLRVYVPLCGTSPYGRILLPSRLRRATSLKEGGKKGRCLSYNPSPQVTPSLLIPSQILRLHPDERSFGYAQDDPAGMLLRMTGGMITPHS